MIDENPYNTAWWGAPVGEIHDASFFDLDPEVREARLKSFSWVEFKAPMAQSPPLVKLHQLGFLLADVQIPFRLALAAVPEPPSLKEVYCRSAKDGPFEVLPEQIQDFQRERFLHIPGITIEQLNQRYARWANQLIGEHPAWCLSIYYQQRVQGWFLSQSTPRGVSLMLAMAAKDSSISGVHLFQCAIRAYAQMGAKVGFASFSVQNTPVLNIYSHLGAKFLPPEGNWLWFSDQLLSSLPAE